MPNCPFHQTKSIFEFDALNPAARENPWLYYDWLRKEESRRMYPLPHEKNFFMVHRFEDVKQVLSDPVTFSSKIIPTRKSLFFVLADGEEHKRIRTIISEVFAQRSLEQFEDLISEYIRNCTAALISAGNAELFDTWADRIPLAVLSILFGMDTAVERLRELHHDNIAINRALFVTGGTGPRRNAQPSFSEKLSITFSLLGQTVQLVKLRRLLGADGMNELLQMLIPEKGNHNIPRPDFSQIPDGIGPMLKLLVAFAEKLKQTGDDNTVMPLLRNAISQKKASLTEMMMACAFIIFAGYETTSSLLSNCFVHLSRHPELFNRLKKHPEEIDQFIDESLRFYTPVGRFLRKATIDTELNGVQIPKDSIILVMNGAANTDPDKFPAGCEFSLSRENASQHLSFGKGPHFCIGAPLALMQIKMALHELISNASSISIDESMPMKMVTDRDNGILRYESIRINVHRKSG